MIAEGQGVDWNRRTAEAEDSVSTPENRSDTIGAETQGWQIEMKYVTEHEIVAVRPTGQA